MKYKSYQFFNVFWCVIQLYDKKVLAKMRLDEQVRNTNPAVEKAYQKYVMLLELTRK